MPPNQNVVLLDSSLRAQLRSAEPARGGPELIGRMFDRFSQDPLVPVAVRAELGRLRIPTLRATQVERDFFTNRSHPARMLLDAIALASMGMDDNAGAAEPTVAAIGRAVHDLMAAFDTDLSPFVAMTMRVSNIMRERSRQEEQAVRLIAREIEARERRQAPDRAACVEVGRRLRSRLWVPSAVREMLLGPWARALAAVHRGEGVGSQAWHELLRVMDELLWSVEPKASAEGRKRLAAVLPQLIQAIVAGLRRAQVSDGEREAFLSALVDLHAHAVRAGLGGVAAPSEALPAPADGPVLQRATFLVGEQRVEEVHLGSEAGTADPGSIPQLRPGAWVELERGARTAARKRLAWSSPVTGTCLFVGAPGAMAVAISPAALAEQVQRGVARLLDPAPLVDRTLAGLLADLAPNQG